MSKKLEPSDFFKAEISPSVYLITWVLFATLLGIVSVFLALGLIGGTVLSYWVGWKGFQDIKKAAHLSSDAIVECQQISSVFWRLRTRVGQSFLVKRRDQAYRSRWLIMLPFETYPQGKKLVLPLARDSLSSKNYTILLSRLL